MLNLNTPELLHAISRQAPFCIMVFDRQGECIHVNEAAHRHMHAEVPVVGKNFLEIWHPDYNNEAKNHMDVVLSGQQMEFEAYRHHGDELQWWSSKLVPIQCDRHGAVDKFAVFGLNITEHKQLKSKVRQMETFQAKKEELANIYDAMLDAVHLTNENYEIELINKSCENMFGVPKMNDKCYDYFHGFDEPCQWCRQDEVFEGKNVITQSFFRKVGRYLESHQSPVRRPDGTVIKLVVLRDITEQKLAKEKLKQALIDKEVLLGEKDLLMREVHHRVSNHLTVMQSLLNLQLREIGDNTARACLLESENRIKVISLIHEHLYKSHDLKQMDAYEYLSSLSNKIFNALKGNKSNVRLHLEIEMITLDIDLLTRLGLLLNEMLTNSMKYAFSGMDEGDIEVGLKKSDAHIQFLFRDNGVGMLKDFDRGKNETLGMQIIDLLVEQMDATIEMKSDAGTGFIVSFREQPVNRNPLVSDGM